MIALSRDHHLHPCFPMLNHPSPPLVLHHQCHVVALPTCRTFRVRADLLPGLSDAMAVTAARTRTFDKKATHHREYSAGVDLDHVYAERVGGSGEGAQGMGGERGEGRGGVDRERERSGQRRVGSQEQEVVQEMQCC